MTSTFQADRPASFTSGKERRIKITAPSIIRWTGLAAVLAGIIFAGIQPVHPADVLASVTTGKWAIIITLKFAMCLLFLIGVTGLYARQADKAGWIGLAGFVLLGFSFWLQTAFVFIELFVLPVVATSLPAFVDSYLGVVNGHPGVMDIGGIASAYGLLSICYLLGGLLFGIATFRAAILPRWAAVLLAGAALITPAAALLPHAIQRYAAIPMGVALAVLGFALWLERRRDDTSASVATPELRSIPTH